MPLVGQHQSDLASVKLRFGSRLMPDYLFPVKDVPSERLRLPPPQPLRGDTKLDRESYAVAVLLSAFFAASTSAAGANSFKPQIASPNRATPAPSKTLNS
jgi:hypothetical protein